MHGIIVSCPGRVFGDMLAFRQKGITHGYVVGWGDSIFGSR